ncbi:MAG: glycosyltransferase family 2 protein [Chitinophagaceae bacterium]
MKISGFTIIKNAVINDYPIVESISSILPVVDEMIVGIGDGDDDTENLVRSIASPKIKIFHTVWDKNLRKGGAVLAAETNKAFAQVSPDSDWAFYIQADEVVHEQSHGAILAAANRYNADKRIDGLLFNYVHFYGTYNYIGDSRRWYSHEIRIIRNDKKIASYKDAQGFRKHGSKLVVQAIDAAIYHYGWVRSPQLMKTKMNNFGKLWNEDSADYLKFINASDVFDYKDYDSLAHFEGTHPSVMQDRINKANWQLDIDTSKKHFSLKGRVLYAIEKLTGRRLFDYKNYRLVK